LINLSSYCHNDNHQNHMTVPFFLGSTFSHALIASSFSIKSSYKMSNSCFEGFVHIDILCSIFFYATFLNLVLKLLIKYHEQYWWYLIGFWKNWVMELLVTSCSTDIIHNLVQLLITNRQSKSKNQLRIHQINQQKHKFFKFYNYNKIINLIHVFHS
jgi:thiosulfate reductase cytochrome b subunit